MKHSVTLSLTFALVACSQMESLALAEASPKQPNVVLIMADDLGAECIGAYAVSYTHLTLPTIYSV